MRHLAHVERKPAYTTFFFFIPERRYDLDGLYFLSLATPLYIIPSPIDWYAAGMHSATKLSRLCLWATPLSLFLP